MGFLKIFGRALDWEESKQYHKIIKDNALEKMLDFVVQDQRCCPKFGYEVIIIHNIYFYLGRVF
jgi:hypothetical protein